MKNPYDILGVPSNATEDEIKKAYRNLSRRYHPDANVNNPNKEQAEERFKEVQQAYQTIMNDKVNGNSGYGNYGNFGGFERNSGIYRPLSHMFEVEITKQHLMCWGILRIAAAGGIIYLQLQIMEWAIRQLH